MIGISQRSGHRIRQKCKQRKYRPLGDGVCRKIRCERYQRNSRTSCRRLTVRQQQSHRRNAEHKAHIHSGKPYSVADAENEDRESEHHKVWTESPYRAEHKYQHGSHTEQCHMLANFVRIRYCRRADHRYYGNYGCRYPFVGDLYPEVHLRQLFCLFFKIYINIVFVHLGISPIFWGSFSFVPFTT